MDFFALVNLFGGLALFLYGMSALSNGLERLSDGRLEKMLEKMTGSVLSGVLLGTVLTGAIQSSSATTVILVGLVNARMMKLHQAIGVIMGANIGTTVTAHILRLTDLESGNFFLRLFKPSTLSPLAAIAGIILMMVCKKTSRKNVGQMLLGFAVLFTGLFAMESAVAPLRELPLFTQLFSTLKNPILGVLVGAGVTAVIQSSSASVGILQALSSTGQITFASAIPIILGQNIGTCVTPLMASVGASKNARRTALVHLFFNVIGTAVFLIALYSYQYAVGIPFWNTTVDKGGIANFHTIFNVTVTLLFLPGAAFLEKLVCKLIQDSPDDLEIPDVTAALDERFLKSPGLALKHSSEAVVTMGRLAAENFSAARGLFSQFDWKACERIREIETVLDKLEDKISAYLLKLSGRELSAEDSRKVSQLLYIISEFERIGDYSINLVEILESMQREQNSFSPRACREIEAVLDAVQEIVGMSVDCFAQQDADASADIEPLEEVIDVMVETLKTRHIERMRRGECTVGAAFPFVEALANLERISDHCSNTAMYIIAHSKAYENFDRHQYIEYLHQNGDARYQSLFKQYQEKYLEQVRIDQAE